MIILAPSGDLISGQNESGDVQAGQDFSRNISTKAQPIFLAATRRSHSRPPWIPEAQLERANTKSPARKSSGETT
jgi:hypothetical protein